MRELPFLENDDKTVRIEWVNAQEGWGGDYNPDDPEDTNLLRFDVYVWEDGEWIDPGNASNCTRVPAETDTKTLNELLHILMCECESDVLKRQHKKTLEKLSWINEKGELS